MIHTSIYRILTKEFIGFWGWQFQLMNISIHSGENDPQWLILWECVILPPPVRLFNVCQTFGSSGDPPVDFRKRLLQKGRFGNPMFVSGAGHFMTDDFSGKCMEKMERKSLIPGNHCLLQLIASQAEGPVLGFSTPCSPSRAPWLRLPQCHGHRQRQMWPKFCRRVQDFWTEVHKMRKSIYKHLHYYVEVPLTSFNFDHIILCII